MTNLSRAARYLLDDREQRCAGDYYIPRSYRSRQAFWVLVDALARLSSQALTCLV